MACRRKSCAGLSLLEVLIALIVLAVAMTSILAIFAAGSASYTRGADNANMSMIAEIVYTDLLNFLRQTQNPGNFADAPVSGYPGYLCDVTFEPIGTDRLAYILRLKIKWTSEGAQRSEEFATVVLRR